MLGLLLKPHAAPYFAVEGYDVNVFPTVDEAASYLEDIDVEDGVYQFFAADGTELRLTTDRNAVIVTDEELGKSPARLAEVLRRSLLATSSAACGELDGSAIEQASLDELVKLFWTIVGPPQFEYPHHWIAHLASWMWARLRRASPSTGSSTHSMR